MTMFNKPTASSKGKFFLMMVIVAASSAYIGSFFNTSQTIQYPAYTPTQAAQAPLQTEPKFIAPVQHSNQNLTAQGSAIAEQMKNEVMRQPEQLDEEQRKILRQWGAELNVMAKMPTSEESKAKATQEWIAKIEKTTNDFKRQLKEDTTQ